MQTAAINDNHTAPHSGPHPDNDAGKNFNAKNAALSDLRTVLAQIDPAFNPAAGGSYQLQDGGHPPVTSDDKSQRTANVFPHDCFSRGWLHEIWSQSPRDHATATAWALSATAEPDKPILWVTSPQILREQGLPYGPGILALGIDPERFILVRAQCQRDQLWALEEGLKSAAFASVVGELEGLDLTSSRRLSLAAQEHQQCCLLIHRSETQPQTVAYSRWQASPTHSACSDTETNNCLTNRLPGLARMTAALGKHRGGMRPYQSLLEWHHAANRFDLVTPLADRTLAKGTQASKATIQLDAQHRAAG